MKIKFSTITLLFIFLIIVNNSYAQNKTYSADWESLKQHNTAPDWFKDAKLGIYCHWGVYTVPEFGSEWYPRNMYLKGTKEFKYHKKTFGNQKVFNYHNFVPKFTAKKFNAEEWVALFKKSGAKFAGLVAQHHDGFALWKSSVNPWNSFDKGPKKDITGELAIELRKNNMKLITTFHHARNLQRNANRPEFWNGFDSHFPYHPNFATASKNPKFSNLYGNISEEQFLNNWCTQISEVVNQYHPDIIWFDSWLNFIPEKKIQQMSAHFFNEAVINNQEVVIAYKQSDLPKNIGIQDIEQGGKRDISESTWMTDITLSNESWSYTKGQTYKSATLVIRNFIDVVSKNGVVLLNISPKADGSIPKEQKEVLIKIGKWLETYGESIYKTKPWDLFGFGNATTSEGHYGGQSSTVEYSSKDIRFTQSKDEKTMYLFFLGKPKVGKKISLELLAKHRYTPHSAIKKMTLLGSKTKVKHALTNTEFSFTIPNAVMNDIATVFKIELE